MKKLTPALSLFLLLSSPAWARDPALEGILQTVTENASRGMRSLVIMDLDETVVDSHTRKFHSYWSAIQDMCGVPETTVYAPKSKDCERALGLSMQDIYGSENGYSQPELMNRLGIRDAAFTKELFRRRREYEDSPRWFSYDTLLPGANEYVRALKRAGASVYFVSSRAEEILREATHEQLIRMGLLLPSEKRFVILRKSEQRSVDFKSKTAKYLKELSAREGTPVVGLFENEPVNLAAWIEQFPTAKAVFVQGAFATPSPVPVTAVSVKTYR